MSLVAGDEADAKCDGSLASEPRSADHGGIDGPVGPFRISVLGWGHAAGASLPLGRVAPASRVGPRPAALFDNPVDRLRHASDDDEPLRGAGVDRLDFPAATRLIRGGP